MPGSNLTRRTLLAGSAATAAAAAVPAAARARTRLRRADVAIVGGGLAGLTAARELRRRGRSVVVLEADDRVGGRTENHPLGGGKVVELMGEWVGPTQDRVLALAKSLGVGTFKTYNAGSNLLYLRGKRSTYPTTQLVPPDDELVADLIPALAAIDQMAAEVDLAAPWKSPHAVEWDSQTLETWKQGQMKTETAREVFDAAVNAIWGADPRDLSLLFALMYVRSAGNPSHPGNLERLVTTPGGAQDSRFHGGSQIVSDRMAQRLGDAVVVSSPVRRITQDAHGVLVESDRVRVRAERVIVAVPPMLGLGIDFHPKLPGRRTQLMQRMPPGTLIKVEAVYDKPFWRADGLSGQVVSDTGPVRTTFDNTPPDGTPGILSGFVGGLDARRWAARSDGARKAAFLGSLATYFGEHARHPKLYIEDSSAAEERWIAGCPTASMPPGVILGFGDVLRTPVGRVHWAGTETSTYWFGYMDGAVRSGERVAAEVDAAS